MPLVQRQSLSLANSALVHLAFCRSPSSEVMDYKALCGGALRGPHQQSQSIAASSYIIGAIFIQINSPAHDSTIEQHHRHYPFSRTRPTDKPCRMGCDHHQQHASQAYSTHLCAPNPHGSMAHTFTTSPPDLDDVDVLFRARQHLP